MKRDFEPGRYYSAPVISPVYQEAFTRIGGLNPYRCPHLMLTWGMDKFWIRRGKKKPQYVGSTKETQRIRKSPTGLDVFEDEVEFFVRPRWCVERWYPFEAICPQGVEYWNCFLRYRWEDGFGYEEGRIIKFKTPVDILGEPPVEGQYRCLQWVLGPDGDYAEPDDEFILAFARAWFERESKGEPSLAQQVLLDRDEQEARFNEVKKIIDGMVDDVLNSTAHWIADPARKRKGGSGTRMVILPGE